MTDEPLGMFEAIYAGAVSGATNPPWDYGAARPQLVEWADARNLTGHGREALVVGCGYGADAEFLAGRGYRTTGSTSHRPRSLRRAGSTRTPK